MRLVPHARALIRGGTPKVFPFAWSHPQGGPEGGAKLLNEYVQASRIPLEQPGWETSTPVYVVVSFADGWAQYGEPHCHLEPLGPLNKKLQDLYLEGWDGVVHYWAGQERRGLQQTEDWIHALRGHLGVLA